MLMHVCETSTPLADLPSQANNSCAVKKEEVVVAEKRVYKKHLCGDGK
jgi:hypothetical protein